MKVEHLDDLALLAHHFKSVDLPRIFDDYLPDHHNWEGLSGGKLVMGWLLYILSESDHRLSHVQSWAASRLNSLSILLDSNTLRELDFSDDRLGRLLDRFSKDSTWAAFEVALGKHFLEVYALGDDQMQVVRSDAFNAPQFRSPAELFRYGYTKHRRSDQTQCKVMAACLDPLAMPVAVDIVSGNGPDFEHYLSVIERTRRVLGTKNNLYVGDSHLGSSGNRLAILLAGDYYLMPLNAKQCTRELRDSYLDLIDVPVDQLPSVARRSGQPEKSAYFHEVLHEMEVDGHCWKERRILCYSPQYAAKQLTSFEERLNKAEEKIKQLVVGKKGRRNPKTLADLYGRAAKIMEELHVKKCFEVVLIRQLQNIPSESIRNAPRRQDSK